ncbi:FtsX-like permease family protein [Clostridioides difficile]|uniref:FtsX-like permease family protein n=1 Tax=Clostridioides difficile TaxID=1496 RepID=UPI0010354DDA|nr:ABC transporter permease [Clostridioides difficile]
MTINKLYSKLRAYNWKNYTTLFFCIILSVVLVTSYALIYFSPTIQNILPTGGDSRKQATMIFSVAILGCAVFTTYASSLFLKFKSKEIGIFMALGTDKKKLKKLLFSEILLISIVCCFLGLILSIPVSFGIWKIFQLVIIDTREMTYHFGTQGFIYGFIFSIFVTLCIFILSVKFINRTNIIDILNDQRISEPIQDVNDWYGILGIIFIILGIFLGYLVPSLTINKLNYRLPYVWSFTYLLSLIGIYMIMTYIVVHAKRGKHPEKYYKNIISTSMMRFMGRQTVKNMCVISFLIAGALFAVFYVPNMVTGIYDTLKNNPIDYTFTYNQRDKQVSKKDIEQLADKHNIKIQNYMEIPSIELIVDGVESIYHKDGTIEKIYMKKSSYDMFFNSKDFSKLIGKPITIKNGEYLAVVNKGNENQDYKYTKFISSPVTEKEIPFRYAGKLIFNGSFFQNRSMNAYVLNEEDYKSFTKDLSIKNYNNSILFNVDKDTYAFANDLKKEIIKRTSKEMGMFSGYDEYVKKRYESTGRKYFMDEEYPSGEGHLKLDPDNNQLYLNWKYYPNFKILQSQDMIKNMAVFLMLFIYVAIICFTAVGIIAYTRGVTIAINHKQVFMDLNRLGANNDYIKFCIRNQLKKVFSYPLIAGSFLIYLFNFMIMLNNDGRIVNSEVNALLINLGFIGICGVYMYLIYLLTYKKFKKIIGIL